MISRNKQRHTGLVQACAVAALAAAATTGKAVAADMPETVLRGSYIEPPPAP